MLAAPAPTRLLAQKTKSLAFNEEIKQIAWKAQHGVRKRYGAFARQGKNKSKIVIALPTSPLTVVINEYKQQQELVNTLLSKRKS